MNTIHPAVRGRNIRKLRKRSNTSAARLHKPLSLSLLKSSSRASSTTGVAAADPIPPNASTADQRTEKSWSLPMGVSANLCDAIAKIAGEDAKPADNLVIRLTAARNRPLAIALPEEISFPGDRIPIIREAARILKAVAPTEDQEIQGYVVKLQAKDDGGIATLSTFIDGQPRKVAISLPDAEHKKAIQAYEQRTEIRCRGELTKSGQLWSLQDPGRVTLLADE